jgi:DNA polymerase III delta subunit
MYQVYFGTDRQKVRDAATAYITKHLSPDGTLTTLEAQNFLPGQVADALGATSLFGGEEWFLFDSPAENEEFLVEVKGALKEMSESANTFIILEGKVLAPEKKSYAKYAQLVEEFAVAKSTPVDSFAMAEALVQKDKRRLWVLLQEARLNGMREEMIVGMLWWQLKSLRLAALTTSAEQAGMNDYPYRKAKAALRNFQAGEVVTLSRSLLELYHAGHSGRRDMDIALEEWVLTL